MTRVRCRSKDQSHIKIKIHIIETVAVIFKTQESTKHRPMINLAETEESIQEKEVIAREKAETITNNMKEEAMIGEVVMIGEEVMIEGVETTDKEMIIKIGVDNHIIREEEIHRKDIRNEMIISNHNIMAIEIDSKKEMSREAVQNIEEVLIKEKITIREKTIIRETQVISSKIEIEVEGTEITIEVITITKEEVGTGVTLEVEAGEVIDSKAEVASEEVIGEEV